LYKLSSWLYRVSGAPILLVAILVFVAFMVLVLPNMAGQLGEITGVDVSPDTSFIYSSTDLYEMAEAYGEEGRAYYIYSRFTFDVAWPLAYVFFLAVTTSYLYRNHSPGKSWKLVNLLPLVGGIFDFLENSAASLVMYRYPLETPVVATLAPVFTFIKWVLIVLSFAVLIIGLLLKVKNFIKVMRTS